MAAECFENPELLVAGEYRDHLLSVADVDSEWEDLQLEELVEVGADFAAERDFWIAFREVACLRIPDFDAAGDVKCHDKAEEREEFDVPNRLLVDLDDTDDLFLLAFVEDSDISRVSVGDEEKLYFDVGDFDELTGIGLEGELDHVEEIEVEDVEELDGAVSGGNGSHPLVRIGQGGAGDDAGVSAKVLGELYEPEDFAPEFYMAVGGEGDDNVRAMGGEDDGDVFSVHERPLVEFGAGQII